MGLYDSFPYTNFHELNLRWILKQLKYTQEYIDTIRPQYFDNVAEMKSADLKAGDFVLTKGYYEVNDGGQSVYAIKETGTGYYETLNNGLAAELLTENVINVKQFGAYCDNLHDDSTALENCLNYTNVLASSNGTTKRTVMIPAIMKVMRRIDCTTDQFKLCGTSLNNSRIVFVGATSYLNIGKPDNQASYEIEIENIKLYGDYSQTQSILKMTRCVNCYLTRVETCNGGLDQYNISFIHCGIIFMDRCTVTGSNNVADFPGNRNGIYIDQIGSIFNFTNANCWNLNNLFKFGGNVQNVNISNNWIECVKSFMEFECVKNMTFMNIKIENNTFNTHNESTFTPGEFNFISLAMAADTNLFSTVFNINRNSIYLQNVTNIKGNSMVYLDGIGNSSNSTWDINYNSNLFTGQTLTDLNAYVFYNSDSTFYNRYNLHFTSVTTIHSGDASRITDEKKIICCVITEHQRGFVTSPNGIYLGKGTVFNDGNIYYENGDFWVGYSGNVKRLPKFSGYTIPYVTAADDMVAYVNQLLTALVRSGVVNLQP